MDKYPLLTLYVTEEGKVHIEMDSVFEEMGCVKASSKIIRGYNEMFIGLADSLTGILIKAQEEQEDEEMEEEPDTLGLYNYDDEEEEVDE